MRSQAVFKANGVIVNRYELCGICTSGTRKLHIRSGRVQDTINIVLALMSEQRRSNCSLPKDMPAPDEEFDLFYKIEIDPNDFLTPGSKPVLQPDSNAGRYTASSISRSHHSTNDVWG